MFPNNQTIECWTMNSCPNVRFGCYKTNANLISTPWKTSNGVCQCAHYAGYSGRDCGEVKIYAKVISFVLLFLYGLVLCLAIQQLFRTFKAKKRSLKCSLNAATTTLLRIAISLIAWIGIQVMDILTEYFIINKNSLAVLYLLLVIVGLSQQVGSAFNVSFLWIEMSASQKLYKIQNITRGRRVLIAMEWGLIFSCIIFSIVFQSICAVMIPVGGFMVLIGISFALGAHSMSKLLEKGSQASGQASKTKTIVSTARTVSIDCAVVVIFGVLYLFSFTIRSIPLGVFSMFAIKLALLHIIVGVVWYLKGKYLCIQEIILAVMCKSHNTLCQKGTRVLVASFENKR